MPSSQPTASPVSPKSENCTPVPLGVVSASELGRNDGAREHNGLRATERGEVRADVFLETIAEHFDGDRRAAVVTPLPDESPGKPDRSFSQHSTSVTGTLSTLERCSTIAGSMSPDRVPITSPSSGVRPIDVSTQWPFAIATAEQPLPRCRAMIVACGSGVRVRAQ
jgi:hypothetical protein